ncbi:flagellin [Niallia oryzisoli]|uniref:flagellin N-terminal helical domain-containing protein n=1 Tax=Niallia oryzisoli TaxID=1737571 RepID=UPI003735BEB7
MIISGSGLNMILNNKMKRTQTSLEKTIEKLATGQRIRSAANDASGLAISQKMLALSRGSNQAIRNVQDATSLVQVADGAMQEMTDILHRIRELTVQSMNGTYSELSDQSGSLTSADTLIIQNEIDDLKKNLNDVVKSTEFNGMKILSNTVPGEYVYENRTAQKDIQLKEVAQPRTLQTERNDVSYNVISPVSQTVKSYEYTSSIVSNSFLPKRYTGTTVSDYQPQWTTDGTSIVFMSSRDGGKYVVPIDGSAAPVKNEDAIGVTQKVSKDNQMRLSDSGSTLYLQKYSSASGIWIEVDNFQYNANDGSNGYSFSPIVDEDGGTSFVYSDNKGNLQKVDVNLVSQTVVGGPESIIPTSDTLNLPPINNTITLPMPPNLYRMNTPNASLIIQKENDNGARELTYWDGTGITPDDGYYTVSGNTISFYGEAIIGNEPEDYAQDYYSFSYVSNDQGNGIFTTPISSDAEIYNMHDGNGPHSLKIRVGDTIVGNDQLLSERPADIEGTNGVFVDDDKGIIEFYGTLRPKHDESVQISFFNDWDEQNGILHIPLSSHIDTYNLKDPDLDTYRSLRVFVGEKEIAYDETRSNGYTFESGYINLYGDARPDVLTNQKVRFEYYYDDTSTSGNVFGIKLNQYPEVYNLGSADGSIRVLRNGTEEIAYSDVDGFQYNSTTNTIELYGTSRPDVNDTYSIQMVVPTGDTNHFDGVVEIPLTYPAETYGETGPSTFMVKVDGAEVSYDPTKTNGYIYNQATNRIELYGNARPKAGTSSTFDVKVDYVYENPKVVAGNDTYDFNLSTTTLDYGVMDQSVPRAIRVYKNGEEVPYNETDGFTINRDTNQLSLHGSFRPTKNDNAGDFYVYSISANDLKLSVDQGSSIYKVIMNGLEIQEADDTNGGYVFRNGQVEIVGDARPDVTKDMSSINLSVQYLESIEIALNDSGFYNDSKNYCDHETDDSLIKAEIDPTSLSVTLNGSKLTTDQYLLQDNKIVLKHDKITAQLGKNTLSVDYRARQNTGYQANDFTFQVGANAGQTLNLEISSFDNMLRDTDIICVRTYEDAAKGLEVIDHAFNFVLGELGKMGAMENTLDHIASNLSVMEENTIASLSRIADTDMAKESMNLMKDQLLAQTQQALTSQLKQSHERIIELLK